MNTSPELTAGLNAKPLRSAPHRLAAGIAVLALGWPVLASADCVDTRKPTAGEMEFHSRAIATLVAALPPVPVGGKLQNKDSVPTLGQQCKGTTGDFSLEATRSYELNYRKAIVSVAINVTQLPATATVPFGAYGSASPSRSAALKVNNVVWRVDGSDSPLRQALADAIDRTRLQALVGKPLPSVAESQALAAQAVPATVAGMPAAAPAAPAPNVPTTQTATQPVAPPNPSAPAAPGQAPASEPIKDAVDTVNKLRGLFSR
jgi:hypothetical protein